MKLFRDHSNATHLQADSQQIQDQISLPNLPVPRKRPSSEALVRQNRTELGIVAKTIPIPTILLSPEQEEDLKAEIVRTWKQHEHCEKSLARLLYRLCAALYAPGCKGKGFRAWLKSNDIPHATAYRWIEKYARREGLPVPYERAEIQKPKRRAEAGTLSQVRQPSSIRAQSAGEEVSPVEVIAAPQSLADFESLVTQFLNGLSPSDRRARAQEWVTWLETEFLTPPIPLSISEVAGD